MPHHLSATRRHPCHDSWVKLRRSPRTVSLTTQQVVFDDILLESYVGLVTSWISCSQKRSFDTHNASLKGRVPVLSFPIETKTS